MDNGNQNRHLRNPNYFGNEKTREAHNRKKGGQTVKRQEKLRAERVKKKRRQKRLAFLTASLALFLVLLALVGVFFYLDASGAQKDRVERSFVLLHGEKDLSPRDTIYRNDQYYIGLSSLCELYGYVISGDSGAMAITMKDNWEDDSAEFIVGTDKAKVNGISVFLDAPCFLADGELYVPASFFGEYVTNTGYEIDAGKRIETALLSVASTESIQGEPMGAQDNAALETQEPDLSEPCGDIPRNSAARDGAQTRADPPAYRFIITGNTPTRALSRTGQNGEPAQSCDYTIDITPYEPYINPENNEEYLFLINQDHRLGRDYEPDDLTDVIFTRKDGRPTQKMRESAAMALEAMLKEAAANGYDSLSVTSGYRSYKTQETLFENEVSLYRAEYKDGAAAKAAQSVAMPGTSEHQSGLCADLHNKPQATQTFANTQEYKWLYENCAKFGFILRYPNGKQEITGIIFEPWHYRFVGKYHALKIMKSGLSLEEYIQKQNQ